MERNEGTSRATRLEPPRHPLIRFARPENGDHPGLFLPPRNRHYSDFAPTDIAAGSTALSGVGTIHPHDGVGRFGLTTNWKPLPPLLYQKRTFLRHVS